MKGPGKGIFVASVVTIVVADFLAALGASGPPPLPLYGRLSISTLGLPPPFRESILLICDLLRRSPWHITVC
jgi:hypothetical protein